MLYFFKRYAVKIVLGLVVLWALVIFAFSAADATESSKTSNGVTYFLCSLLVSDFDDMKPAAKRAVIRQFSLRVRKTAHFTEYLILGFLLMSAMYVIRKHRTLRSDPALAWLIGTLYAVSDECHQYFVPGRAMMLTDMLIDSSGTLVGVLLGCLIYYLRESCRPGRHDEPARLQARSHPEDLNC